jgi:hypothetical protein
MYCCCLSSYRRIQDEESTLAHTAIELTEKSQSDLQEQSDNTIEALVEFRLKCAVSAVNWNKIGQLHGKIGAINECGGLKVRGGQLVQIDLSFSGLRGALPLSFIRIVARLRAQGGKETVKLNGNRGFTLPESMDALGDDVDSLDLSSCSLVEGLPPSLANLPQLRYLDVSFNDLTPQLPLSIGKLKAQGCQCVVDSGMRLCDKDLDNVSGESCLDYSKLGLEGTLPLSLILLKAAGTSCIKLHAQSQILAYSHSYIHTFTHPCQPTLPHSHTHIDTSHTHILPLTLCTPLSRRYGGDSLQEQRVNPPNGHGVGGGGYGARPELREPSRGSAGITRGMCSACVAQVRKIVLRECA